MSFFHVFGPTIPSTPSPLRFWKLRTAWSVSLEGAVDGELLATAAEQVLEGADVGAVILPRQHRPLRGGVGLRGRAGSQRRSDDDGDGDDTRKG